MSITLDYFFNHEGDLPAVAQVIDRALGSALRPYEGEAGHLFCRFLSIELTLGYHTLDNDRDCDFSSYRYQLGTRTSVSDADLRAVQIGMMALIPLVLFQRAGISAGIVVYDTQRLLARYRQSDNQPFDEIDGRPVTLPEHHTRLSQQSRRSP